MKRMLMMMVVAAMLICFSSPAFAGYWGPDGMTVERIQVLNGGDTIRVGFTWTAANGAIAWKTVASALTSEQRRILLATILTLQSSGGEVIAELNGAGGLTGFVTK